MKTISLKNITLAAAFLTCVMVWNMDAQISIVVGKSSTAKATTAELREIFSGARTTWQNGNKIQVVDQPETDAGKLFYQKFVEKSFTQVRTQWMKLVLSGQASAPVKCVDDASVKKAVAENPNAIGYVSSGSLDGTVKEIGRVE